MLVFDNPIKIFNLPLISFIKSNYLRNFLLPMFLKVSSVLLPLQSYTTGTNKFRIRYRQNNYCRSVLHRDLKTEIHMNCRYGIFPFLPKSYHCFFSQKNFMYHISVRNLFHLLVEQDRNHVFPRGGILKFVLLPARLL